MTIDYSRLRALLSKEPDFKLDEGVYISFGPDEGRKAVDSNNFVAVDGRIIVLDANSDGSILGVEFY